MKLFTLTIAICMLFHTSWAGDDQQIKLEDIEQDTLKNEEGGEIDHQIPKELLQPTQHIELNYSNEPQDVFVTPQPRYNHKEPQADLRSQVYHLPKVHEAEQTYTVPAKQTLIQPFIGGSQPITPHLTPQPQYIYIPSPHHHQNYIPQAQAYVMVPYASHYTPQAQIHMQPHQHHHVLSQPQISAPEQAIYSYSHAPPAQNHQQSYQAVKSIEYSLPSSLLTPLQTAVDYRSSAEYKNSAPLPIVPRKTLPSISQTSFQQYYSPGLEYHYTEAMPITKLSPQSSYSYQHTPTHNFHTNYASQTPSYNFYQSAPSSSYNKHQSSGLLESYVPSLSTYRQQQYKERAPMNYYQTQYQPNHHQYSSTQIPQQLFTPSQQHYSPYPSAQAYNTIQYSVPMSSVDVHSKRSTSKATATLSVKAPKDN